MSGRRLALSLGDCSPLERDQSAVTFLSRYRNSPPEIQLDMWPALASAPEAIASAALRFANSSDPQTVAPCGLVSTAAYLVMSGSNTSSTLPSPICFKRLRSAGSAALILFIAQSGFEIFGKSANIQFVGAAFDCRIFGETQRRRFFLESGADAIIDFSIWLAISTTAPAERVEVGSIPLG